MSLKINDEVILICAFRYALGRMTYVVDNVVNAIIDNWKELPIHTQTLIKNEIIQYRLEYGLCGMEMDDKNWQRIMML